MVSKIVYLLKMFHFLSSGLGAYDKAVIRDNETGEVIGEIHEFVHVAFCINLLHAINLHSVITTAGKVMGPWSQKY